MNESIVSHRVEGVIARIRKVYRNWGGDTPIAQMRKDWDDLFAPSKTPVLRQDISAGKVPARWIDAPGVDKGRVALYFHGGGYQLGSLDSHDELMAGISAASNGRVLGVDYRLAPEHRFPAAFEDGLAAYRWLLRQGYRPNAITFVGDSAGAGLALAALIVLRDRGGPLPSAAVTMSAWTDLTASGESYESRSTADPIHQKPMILAMARRYLGQAGDPRDLKASPLFAGLAGLPPLLIQVGDRETVLDDSRAFAAKATSAGVEVELQVWDGMIHVFQMFPAELIEARQAIAAIGRFIHRHTAASPNDVRSIK